MKYRINISKGGHDATIIVSYNVDGLLENIEFVTNGLTPKQITWILEYCVDAEEANVRTKVGDLVFIKVTEIPQEVSFAIFWDLYNYKVGRLQAEREWNKLSKEDQGRAIQQAPKYHQWRKQKAPPQEAVHPERFLKNRRFDDEFKI